ncbi:MAG: recombinase family protein [Chloroflexota bacterium]|nr:recombinase family protein [Chloroflexota bacterium]
MAPAKNCIIYVRVSSDEQARGYSLPTQVESCCRYSTERGYTVVGTFQDAHSGTELDRPGLNATIAAVAALKPHAVVLHDVDRLGREPIVQAIAERELTKHGARIEYVLGGGTDSASDILLKGVKQALAVYENYQRVERSRRGKNGRVQAGGVLVAARPAYGYRYISGDRTGWLEPDPDEAPIVAQIFSWCADDGLTTYEIAKRLFAAGVPTRADTNPSVVHKTAERHFWDPHSVARILRNETHKGVWHWNKTKRVQRGERKVQESRPREEWLTVTVPVIVDEATWERAQEQLSRNKQQARRNAKREYLLSGRVFCSCGRRFTGRYKNHLDRAYYRCPTSETEPWRAACTTRFGYEQTKLERGVLDRIKAFLLDPEIRAAGVTAEQGRLAVECEQSADQLKAVDRHLAEIDRRLASLLDDALIAGFPEEIVDRRKRDLLAERERRHRERDQALTRLAAAHVPDLEIAVRAMAPTVERAFAVAEPSELRQLLDLLRVEVHVIDRKTVRLTGVVGGPGGSIVELSPA